MPTSAPPNTSATIWRVVKIFLGAWAFAVAGVAITSVMLIVVVGPTWPLSYMRYAAVGLFVVGIPIMRRWLK